MKLLHLLVLLQVEVLLEMEDLDHLAHLIQEVNVMEERREVHILGGREGHEIGRTFQISFDFCLCASEGNPSLSLTFSDLSVGSGCFDATGNSPSINTLVTRTRRVAYLLGFLHCDRNHHLLQFHHPMNYL